MVQPVHLRGIGAHSFCDRLRGDEAIFQTRQHPRLDLVARDGAVVGTSPATMVIEAAVAVRRQDADPAAAASTGEKAGKEGDGPVGEVQPLGPALPRIGRVGTEEG